MVFFKTFIFLYIYLTLVLTSSTTATQDLANPDITLTNVFVGGQEGYACYRIPALINTPKGLFAFAEGRKNNCNDHGYVDLVMKSSTDGGINWSPLKTVRSESTPNNFTTVGNPCPVYLESTSTILLPYCINNKAAFFLTSTDYGQTWSNPNPLPDIHTNWIATGPPGSLQLSTGRILIPIDRQNASSDYYSQAFYSDDMGKTWNISETMILHGDEAQIASLPWINSSTLILSMRTTVSYRGVSFSYDAGVTWGPLTPIITENQCEGSIVALPYHSSGPILVISSSYNTNSRINMTIHVSRDNGKSFIPEILVYSGPSAYSSLVSLESSSTVLNNPHPYNPKQHIVSKTHIHSSTKSATAAASPSVGLLFEADNYSRIVYTTVTIN